MAYSKDGGISWGKFFEDTALIEPICQASLLMVPPQSGESYTLFFLNPAHETERRMMTLRTSFDAGGSWQGKNVLHRGPAAYSDMCFLRGGSLGCLYEAGVSNPYQGIVFQQVPISSLLN